VIDPHPPSACRHLLDQRQDGLIARTPDKPGPEDDGLKACAVVVAHGLFRQSLGPAVRVRAVKCQRSGLIDTAQMLAADYGGFRPHVNESPRAGLLGSAENTPGSLDVDAIPGVRRSPLLDKRGAMNHDLSASDIGSGHHFEIAPDRLGTDSANLLVARRRARHGANPVPFGSQSLGRSTTDEARGSRDEDVHGIHSHSSIRPKHPGQRRRRPSLVCLS